MEVAEVEIKDEYSVKDAARYLGIRIAGRPYSAGWLYNLIDAKAAPRFEKRRNRVIFRRHDLDAWLKDNTETRRAHS